VRSFLYVAGGFAELLPEFKETNSGQHQQIASLSQRHPQSGWLRFYRQKRQKTGARSAQIVENNAVKPGAKFRRGGIWETRSEREMSILTRVLPHFITKKNRTEASKCQSNSAHNFASKLDIFIFKQLDFDG